MVDVSNLESSSGGPELTVAALPKTGEIVLLEMSQRFHVDHLEKVMDAALKGCTDIYNILDKVVRKHVEKSSSALEQITAYWTNDNTVVINTPQVRLVLPWASLGHPQVL